MPLRLGPRPERRRPSELDDGDVEAAAAEDFRVGTRDDAPLARSSGTTQSTALEVLVGHETESCK